jgi:hypothetical protein
VCSRLQQLIKGRQAAIFFLLLNLHILPKHALKYVPKHIPKRIPTPTLLPASLPRRLTQ